MQQQKAQVKDANIVYQIQVIDTVGNTNNKGYVFTNSSTVVSNATAILYNV